MCVCVTCTTNLLRAADDFEKVTQSHETGRRRVFLPFSPLVSLSLSLLFVDMNVWSIFLRQLVHFSSRFSYSFCSGISHQNLVVVVVVAVVVAVGWSAPNFVSSFAHGDYVYFTFRETAVEYMNCGKVNHSKQSSSTSIESNRIELNQSSVDDDDDDDDQNLIL